MDKGGPQQAAVEGDMRTWTPCMAWGRVFRSCRGPFGILVSQMVVLMNWLTLGYGSC